MDQTISGSEIFLKVHSVEQIRNDLAIIDIEVLVIDGEKVLPYQEIELTLGDRSQGVITRANGRMRNHLVFNVDLMQRQTLRARLTGTQGGEATYQILPDNYETLLAQKFMSAPIASPQVQVSPPAPQDQPIPTAPPTPVPQVPTSPTIPPVSIPKIPPESPTPPTITPAPTGLDTSVFDDILSEQTKTDPIMTIELDDIGNSDDRLNIYRRIVWIVSEGQSVKAGDLLGNVCDDPDGVSVTSQIRAKKAGRIHKLMNFNELTDEILHEVVAEYIPA